MLTFLNKHLEEILGAVILALMVVVAFLNVVVRYCTNFSFAWSEEVTINLFVWTVMLGTSAVFRDGGHLGMNLIYTHCRESLRLCFAVLSLVLSIAFFSVLFYYGLFEVIDEIDLEASSESLGIPVWWYTGAVPLLSVLICLRIVQRFMHDLVQHKF
ncbi:MAG: TRAP transporter small permease [Succinivibrio sp.]|nr:TRAP transporter small permease [Succinivibrio sp.]